VLSIDVMLQRASLPTRRPSLLVRALHDHLRHCAELCFDQLIKQLPFGRGCWPGRYTGKSTRKTGLQCGANTCAAAEIRIGRYDRYNCESMRVLCPWPFSLETPINLPAKHLTCLPLQVEVLRECRSQSWCAPHSTDEI